MSTDHVAFYAKQISLTEWLDQINHAEAEAIRKEDNDKRERLGVLNQAIGLPYDKPYQFSGTDVAKRTPEFQMFLSDHGHELCAIRLIPTKPDLPKLRMRGKNINEAVAWFDEQRVNARGYRVDFVPHSEKTDWATIFVVNEHGVYGEITQGPHSELTQGFHGEHRPITFSYDYRHWSTDPYNQDAEAHLQKLITHLEVADATIRRKLTSELGASFSHNILQGYFETTASPETSIWFIDYNQALGKMYADFIEPPASTQAALVRGRVGCKGVVTGRVRIMEEDELASARLEPDEILVCRMTTPAYLPLMQQAAAIVTDLGGILSHAAIVARELGKPCITATGNATSVLAPGQVITVDADTGTVIEAR